MWANPDEAYPSPAMNHGRATAWWGAHTHAVSHGDAEEHESKLAARAGPLVTEVGPNDDRVSAATTSERNGQACPSPQWREESTEHVDETVRTRVRPMPSAQYRSRRATARLPSTVVWDDQQRRLPVMGATRTEAHT